MRHESFGQELADVGNPPCAKCLWLERCALRQEACRDFSHWVSTGQLHTFDKHKRLQPRNRKPMKKIYDRIYRPEDL